VSGSNDLPLPLGKIVTLTKAVSTARLLSMLSVAQASAAAPLTNSAGQPQATRHLWQQRLGRGRPAACPKTTEAALHIDGKRLLTAITTSCGDRI